MKRLKGFTLIECLIAMFILGVSSLLLVQGYSTLMKLTTRTNTIDISIAQQMADAEGVASTARDAVSNSTAVHTGSTDSDDFGVQLLSENYMTIELYEMAGKKGTAMNKASLKYNPSGQYNSKIKVYMVLPYKAFNQSSSQTTIDESDAGSKDGTDMRFVYFHK